MEEYNRAVADAVLAAETALQELLETGRQGGRIDTRALKEITAALKDLNGLTDGGGGGAAGVVVRFEGFAEEAAR